MVLEFLSEADASSAFKINNAGDLLNIIFALYKED